MSSRLTHRHSSHRSITGNPTVSKQNPSRYSFPDRFFSERSGFYNHRSCPGGTPSQQERTKHRRQEQIELEVDGVCHSRAVSPWGQRFCRCLWSAQIGRRGPLFHPGKLRGEALLPCVPSVSLRGVPANTQTIESLAPRIKTLSAALCTSASGSDSREQGRRMKLEQ